MAKHGDKFSAIRMILTEQPKAAPVKVIRLVRRRYGLTVSPSSVARVKQELTGTLPPSIQARSKKAAPVQVQVHPEPVAPVTPPTSVAVADLCEIRELARRLGGVPRLISLARVVESLAA